jgi:RNA polymerase sporulation-specific sigma factor
MENLKLRKKAYDENLDLLKKYREGDALAGERLAELNMPLVYSIATRLSLRGGEMSDLVECGTIGLVKAMRTFDFSHGTAFSTYAVPLIFGEIRRFLRDDGIIKVSREDKRLSAKLLAERERRLADGGDVRIAALAEAVGVTPQDAARAIHSQNAVRSLDEAAFEDEDSLTLGNIVTDEDEEERSFDRIALRDAIDHLAEQQKKIVLLRYFRDLSQVETAKILGITQVKVSREEKKIMEKLKELLS